MFYLESARRAQNRDGWLRDATGTEPFCRVHIGFEQKRLSSEAKDAQNGAHGEISGLASPGTTVL